MGKTTTRSGKAMKVGDNMRGAYVFGAAKRYHSAVKVGRALHKNISQLYYSQNEFSP